MSDYYHRILSWLRRKVKDFLDLPDIETIMGVDVGHLDATTAIVIRYDKRSGRFDVIADYQLDSREYQTVRQQIQELIERHHVSSYTVDWPMRMEMY